MSRGAPARREENAKQIDNLTEYTALGIPPAYLNLDLEVEIIHPYEGRNVKEIITTTGYFDPALNEFHNCPWGRIRGKVLRWLSRDLHSKTGDARHHCSPEQRQRNSHRLPH